MMKLGTILAGTAVGLFLAAGQAVAGPCADQIDQVSRQLSGGKGAGTLAGAAPGGAEKNAPMPQTGTPDGAAEPTAGGVKGEAVATTMAGNAPDSMAKPVDPANGIATSPQDVRLQQQGMPTAAQGGNPVALDQRMQQAMAAVERARSLDQQGSQDCTAALDEAKRLGGISGGG